MGGLLHPARHKTIVSGAEGVFSVSLGRGMVYLPLTARNEDPGNDDAPAPAPEPTPREKPKNHKISVSGVLGVFSASLGRGMVVLLSLFCCWRMCRRRGGSRAARTCTRAGPGAASKSRRRYNVVFDVSGVLPLDPGHAHAHAHAHALSARHSLHVTPCTSLSVRRSLHVTLCIRTRTRSMIYIG